MTPEVKAAFDAMPDKARAGCLGLRALIFEVTEATPGVGALREELRWGQPAYLSARGTTIRLGVPKAGGYGLFVHCQTTLIGEFRVVAPQGTRFDGNRGVLFEVGEAVDREALALLIRAALTYHM